MAAVVGERRLEGSVPGDDPILGLAVLRESFLLGTSDGLLTSADGFTWRRVPGFGGETLVAGAADMVVVVSGGRLSATSDLRTFDPLPADPGRATALAAASDGTVWVAGGSGRLLVVNPDGSTTRLSLKGGPRQVLSLAVLPGEPRTILAGGLSDGLWRSVTAGREWEQILGTPIRAVQADPAEPGRYLIGTAAGALTASRTAPEFTDLRQPVEALAESAGTFYAITLDRLLYESEDGTTWSVRAQDSG